MKSSIYLFALAFISYGLGSSITHAQLRSDLRPGDTNQEVVLLQKILNIIDRTVARSGPGSKGHETAYFGAMTAAAVRAFQCERGIVCEGDPDSTGFGMIGPRTRGILNVFSHLFPPLPPATSTATTSAKMGV